jgi:hypothetical protein
MMGTHSISALARIDSIHSNANRSRRSWPASPVTPRRASRPPSAASPPGSAIRWRGMYGAWRRTTAGCMPGSMIPPPSCIIPRGITGALASRWVDAHGGVEKIVATEGGFDLWRTQDGMHCTCITRTGLGNPLNLGVRTLKSTPVGLFVGSYNFFTEVIDPVTGELRGGAEIWVGTPQDSAAPRMMHFRSSKVSGPRPSRSTDLCVPLLRCRRAEASRAGRLLKGGAHRLLHDHPLERRGGMVMAPGALMRAGGLSVLSRRHH